MEESCTYLSELAGANASFCKDTGELENVALPYSSRPNDKFSERECPLYDVHFEGVTSSMRG
jgi:hypothetical protein